MAVKTSKIINGVKTPVSPASVDAEMQNRYNESVFNKVNPNVKEVKYDGSDVTVKNNGAVTGNVNGSVPVLGKPDKPATVKNLPNTTFNPTVTKLPFTSANPAVTPFNALAQGVAEVNIDENKKQQGADDIMLTEYFAGRPNARVVWNDETRDVYINGVAVPKSEVLLKGGKAFVSRSLAENILKSTQANDPSSPDAMHERYGKLFDKFEADYDRLNSGDPFEYDYRTDPSYKAYSDYYDALADAAVDEALSQLMSRTGGYVNSNALAAAYKARNNFMREKANIIPQLEQQAYGRWMDGKKLKSDNVNNALANIRGLLGDYTAAISDQQRFELDKENSVLDRGYKYDELGVYDANEDAALISQEAQFYAELDEKKKQWEAETGISYASLSLQERSQLLDEWIAQQEYGKKPVVKPGTVPVSKSVIPLN